MRKTGEKVVSLCLVLLLVAAMLISCGKTPEPENHAAETDGIKLWWAYNTENLMQDFEYDYDRDSTLRFYGIKGDVESIQLMITPDKDVLDYNFTMGDIATQSGAVISADCFEIYAEHYMEVMSSYNPDSFFGYYPDALVPMENYRFRRYNSINAGKNQGIWLNLNIPVDAQAGTYTGEGKLTLDGKEYAIPVELTVYNVTMPEEVHAQSSYLIWYDYVASGEGDASPEMYESYFWFLANKRVFSDLPGPHATTDYAAYVDYVAENFAENPKIPCYGLPYSVEVIDGVNHLNENRVLDMLNRLADKILNCVRRGMTPSIYFKKPTIIWAASVTNPIAPKISSLCGKAI